jgi:hypothetical protein
MENVISKLYLRAVIIAPMSQGLSAMPMRSGIMPVQVYRSFRNPTQSGLEAPGGGCSTESVSGGGEVVLAFYRLEEIAGAPDLPPEGIDGPDGLCAQLSFKLRQGSFRNAKSIKSEILIIVNNFYQAILEKFLLKPLNGSSIRLRVVYSGFYRGEEEVSSC